MNSTDRQAVVATHFDAYAANNRWGDLYNRANPHSHSFLARRRKTVELLGDLRGKHLLDIGCGTGALMEPLLETTARYEGVDVAPQMIQVAQRHLEQLGVEGRFRVRLGSALALPYPENHFDAVAGMGLLEYFDNPEMVIREAIRVAKPGARLVFTIPQKICLDAYVVRAAAPARYVARRMLRKPTEDIERDRYTPKEFQNLFLKLGCRITGERFYNKLLLPYPVTRLMPMTAYAVARVLEPIRGFSFLTTGYILACEK